MTDYKCIAAPFISKFGIKFILVAGCVGFPVYGAALYYNSFKVSDPFLIVGGLLCGLSAGILWNAESTIFTAFPLDHQRGFYLGYVNYHNNMQTLIFSILFSY